MASILNKLTFIDSVSPEYLHIILDYWLYKDNHFINTPEKIAAKYQLTLKKLTGLVENNSVFEFQAGYCIRCGRVLMTKTARQVNVAEIFSNSFMICNKCDCKEHAELRKRQVSK